MPQYNLDFSHDMSASIPDYQLPRAPVPIATAPIATAPTATTPIAMAPPLYLSSPLATAPVSTNRTSYSSPLSACLLTGQMPGALYTAPMSSYGTPATLSTCSQASAASEPYSVQMSTDTDDVIASLLIGVSESLYQPPPAGNAAVFKRPDTVSQSMHISLYPLTPLPVISPYQHLLSTVPHIWQN